MRPPATMQRCSGCGRPVDTARLFCSACGRAVGSGSRTPFRTARKSKPLPVAPFVVGGLFAGAGIGFWLRPTVAFGRQLPLEAVLTRGATLRGVDTLLVATAQASFNRMVVMAVAGAVVGLLMNVLIRRVR